MRTTLALAALAATVVLVAVELPVTFNTTESLPIGFYRMEPVGRPLVRGDLVVVCPPLGVVPFVLRRRYLRPGICPGGSEAMLKYVAGIAGDRIDLRPSGVFVDGRPLANSRRHARDSLGRAMPSPGRGRLVVARGQLWLWTPNPIGLDSRYYGPVAAANVRGLAHLLVQTEPWPYSSELPSPAPQNG